ncbi:hypothetical protein ACFZBF_45580 [Streptomyces pseudovenezuelae]|uniref:hypothetical protein n=1 Tax=Streptomyces pseudovenezuelae TaxID=67350 RepID=UPI0036E82158
MRGCEPDERRFPPLVKPGRPRHDEHIRRVSRKLLHRPSLQRAAQQAHTTGVPVMRAMLLEFPDEPTAALLDRQYMLGDDG